MKTGKYFPILFVLYFFSMLTLKIENLNFTEIYSVALITTLLFNILWLFVFYRTARHSERGISELGFTFNEKIIVPVLFGFFVIMFMIFTGYQFSIKITLFSVTAAFTALISEIIFRVFLIRYFIDKLKNNRYGPAISILISSILFTILIIPGNNTALITGSLLASVIFASVYYWSKSIFLGLFLNIIGAAGSGMAVFILVLYFVLSLLNKGHLIQVKLKSAR